MPCIKQILCKEKSKKLDFWKFQCQNGVGELSRHAVKTPFFDSQLFFKSPLAFFLWVIYTYWRYIKGPFNLVHYDNKKKRNVWNIKQIICKKKSKKLDFWKFQCQKKELPSSQDMLWKPRFLTQNFFSKSSRIFSMGRIYMFKVSKSSA